MSLHRWYRLKKWYAIYPGFVEPICADILAAHYEARRRARTLPRAALDCLVAALFQLWVPARAWQVQKRYALTPEWRRGITPLARRRFVDPDDIALLRIAGEHELATVIRRYEFAGLNKCFNPAGWRRDCALADKWRFFERCRSAALPHPIVYGCRRGGAWAHLTAPVGEEIAVKRLGGSGGRGFRLLRAPTGAARSDAAWRAWLDATLPAGEWLVQERLCNHRDLAELVLNALSTTRITTMLDEKGRPEITGALQRFAARPEAVVDNATSGGFVAPVDPGSGRLRKAYLGRSRGDIRAEWARHPLTGGRIEGVALPGWESVCALVLDAHARAFPEYTMIGWDVAITPGGPVLIEGNCKPNIITNQRAARCGAGAERTGVLIRHHLQVRATRLERLGARGAP